MQRFFDIDINFVSLNCYSLIYYHAGFRFWKVNSRKFYAVPEESLFAPAKRRRQRRRRDSSPSPPPASAVQCSCQDALDELKEEMRGGLQDLKAGFDKIFKLTSDLNVPLGLKSLLSDTLKCRICHRAPMEPPIVTSKCSGEDALTKKCPNCRADRGYAETFRLHGLEDLMTGLCELLADEGTADN